MLYRCYIHNYRPSPRGAPRRLHIILIQLILLIITYSCFNHITVPLLCCQHNSVAIVYIALTIIVPLLGGHRVEGRLLGRRLPKYVHDSHYNVFYSIIGSITKGYHKGYCNYMIMKYYKVLVCWAGASQSIVWYRP